MGDTQWAARFSRLMVVGVAALAQLFVLATRANLGAKTTTRAAVFALQKMEQLRGLAPSPGGALGSNTAGYCDFLDETGRSLGDGSTPPPGTDYIRRWSIEPLAADPANALVIQVRVLPLKGHRAADEIGTRRLPDEARIVSLKTRKAT